jgi:hypothetical protein
MSNGHIFISYRRDDSAGYTRAIYDQLAERFTQERIFMDVDAIEPGLPFDEVINQAVSRCEILLVMIGNRWMELQAGGGPRINDEKDFVRLEIAAALSRNVRVIPVLLDGAGMPTEELLPEPLRALARRNAIEISNTRFKSDVDRLVEVVSKVLGESNVPSSQERSRPHRTTQYWLLSGLIAVALFSSIAYFYSPTKENSKKDAVTKSQAPSDSAPIDGCLPPYVWRLAVPSDHVCVTEDSRKRVELENQRAAERREASGVGPYGADTCLVGYVWREAFEGDTVCVLPSRRDEVRNENALASQRIKR